MARPADAVERAGGQAGHAGPGRRDPGGIPPDEKKARQDQLKDVGGYVGGPLRDQRRKAANVLGRDIVTLDLDNIQPGQTDRVLGIIDGLGCAYCVYSTRKRPEAPRLRVLIPLDHTAAADESTNPLPAKRRK